MEYSRELYVQRLIDRMHNGLIKIVTGARRSGKSYLLNVLFYRHLIKSGVKSTNILRFAFDFDEDLDRLEGYLPDEPVRIKGHNGTYLVNAKKFRAYLRDHTNDQEQFFLLLDEVQLLDNFTGTLGGLLRHANLDVYVTGSNSHFLSSDLATEFKGRGSVVHVLPLSFSEYMTGTTLSCEEAWKEYIVTGGIPLVAQMKTAEEKISYLKHLSEEIYLKDLMARHGIKKQQEFAETLNVVASTIGAPVSLDKLSRTFKSVSHQSLSSDTLARFISLLEDAFVLTKVHKFNLKGRRYIGTPFKLYFEDLGVRNVRLNFRQIEEPHLMENVLYNELRYRGFNVDTGEVAVSEKTDRVDVNGKFIYAKKALEVDFIASFGSRKFYVQSALSLADPDKQREEKRSLYYIDDSFKKIVVAKTGLHPAYDEKGVVTVDLFDFLMHKEILS